MSAGSKFAAGSVRHCRVPKTSIASIAMISTEPTILSLARSRFM